MQFDCWPQQMLGVIQGSNIARCQSSIISNLIVRIELKAQYLQGGSVTGMYFSLPFLDFSPKVLISGRSSFFCSRKIFFSSKPITQLFIDLSLIPLWGRERSYPSFALWCYRHIAQHLFTSLWVSDCCLYRLFVVFRSFLVLSRELKVF